MAECECECECEWGEEEGKEWLEGTSRIQATIRKCKKCGKEEITGGVMYTEGRGVYELLPPDGSMGGALCAAGW